MTIKVNHYHANRKIVAVLASCDDGIYLPAANGVAYMTAAGHVDHIRKGVDLDMLLKLASTRVPVYEDAVVTIEPGKGFTVEHAPVPELVAVLGEGGVGVFVQNQSSNSGVTFLDSTGQPSRVYPNLTMQDALDENPERVAICAGSTISFTV